MTARDGETSDTDDLRARFQQQGRPGFAAERARKARGVRILFVVMSAVASVVSLVIIAVGLNAGVGVGLWVGVCALAAAVGVGGVFLAVRGRTRWATAGFVVAYTLGALGDILSNRPLQ